MLSALKSSKKSATEKNNLNITIVNDDINTMKTSIAEVILEKKEFKKMKKKDKKNTHHNKPIAYWLTFQGDMKASASQQLKDEITAILTLASPKDEVIISIDSPGGAVNQYGFAASQLERIRSADIPLTVCIDKVGASGGYLMACVANKILAAPFSMVGSIGVWMGIPNFNNLMKKNHIQWEEITAGDHKRNLSLLGEITHDDRLQAQEQANQVHDQFKAHIKRYRPQLDLDKIADGTVWLGSQALEQQLIDAIMTTEDYIQKSCIDKMVIKLNIEPTKTWLEKCLKSSQASLSDSCIKLIKSWALKS